MTCLVQNFTLVCGELPPSVSFCIGLKESAIIVIITAIQILLSMFVCAIVGGKLLFYKEPSINTVKKMSGFGYGLDSDFKLHNIINELDKQFLPLKVTYRSNIVSISLNQLLY
jgi:hypothetical protein